MKIITRFSIAIFILLANVLTAQNICSDHAALYYFAAYANNQILEVDILALCNDSTYIIKRIDFTSNDIRIDSSYGIYNQMDTLISFYSKYYLSYSGNQRLIQEVLAAANGTTSNELLFGSCVFSYKKNKMKTKSDTYYWKKYTAKACPKNIKKIIKQYW